MPEHDFSIRRNSTFTASVQVLEQHQVIDRTPLDVIGEVYYGKRGEADEAITMQTEYDATTATITLRLGAAALERGTYFYRLIVVWTHTESEELLYGRFRVA